MFVHPVLAVATAASVEPRCLLHEHTSYYLASAADGRLGRVVGLVFALDDLEAERPGLSRAGPRVACPEQRVQGARHRLLRPTSVVLDAVFVTAWAFLAGSDRAYFERQVAKARAELDVDGFAAGWAAGATRSLEEAIAEALGELTDVVR